MKKSSMIMGSMFLLAMSGYGMWCMYKKICPECADKVKCGVKKIKHNMEKSMEDMM